MKPEVGQTWEFRRHDSSSLYLIAADRDNYVVLLCLDSGKVSDYATTNFKIELWRRLA